MGEIEPTAAQRRVIEEAEGITVVDAGAGTGKTFTITRRYAELVSRPAVDPEDILLVTFTRNAADEVRERIVASSDASPTALRQAPIDTFHGVAHDLLLEHGHDVPTHLGIDERITDSTQLLEDPVIESQRFRSFYRRFVEDHPEHEAFVTLVDDPSSLLSLTQQLCAKGVFPTADGWYRGGRDALVGDVDRFADLFAVANEPNQGQTGPTQSDLRQRLSSYDRDRCYPPDAPEKRSIRGDRGCTAIDDEWAARAFDEDRDALFAFVHDVYHGYLRFALRRNYLNFGFLQLFAYVLLVEDHHVRETVRFPFVIVDEFQDTSELQFKLVLLLSGTDEICVVGDWKQSIYGFQYAEVANIRAFEPRLRAFVEHLNDDHERVPYDIDDVDRISLTENFRSTQPILDIAERALAFPATTDDTPTIDLDEDITSLEAQVSNPDSQVEAVQSVEQVDAVLACIQRIEGSESYPIRTSDGGSRTPDVGDIAVVTRKRRFGRKLRHRAAEVGIPVAYEGGVDLFGTDHGIMVLAWLRIVETTDDPRGWAVVLEEAGYRIDEIDRILETQRYPAAFTSFLDELTAIDRIGTLVRTIMNRYGYRDAYADTIVSALERVHAEHGGTLGDLVRYIEQSIETGATYEIADDPGGDAVTVQTIHAAKGLEYPIVILADVSRYSFPPTGSDTAPIRFEDPIGLRQTKAVAAPHGHDHVYDNWRHRVLSAALRGEYDEERRLLYVAMTRAEDHLVVTAGEEPSPFFASLPLAPTRRTPELEPREHGEESRDPLAVSMPTVREPIQLTAHDLLDDEIFETTDGGRGTAFGARIHEFAERYANGEHVTGGDTADERHVASFLDSLGGDVRTEVPLTLPLVVDGVQVTISGTADLLHVTDTAVEIVDYKTDVDRTAATEYRVQLSVYYHVVAAVMDDRDVGMALFYTTDEERNPVLPLDRERLEARVRAHLRERGYLAPG